MSLFENSNQQDQRLIGEMRQGSRRAEDEFHKKFHKKLVAFLRNQGAKEAAVAEDCATEAITEFWVKYIKSEVEFDFGRGTVLSYLCQVAKNTFLKNIRDNRTGKQDSITVENEEGLSDEDQLEAIYDDIDRKSNEAMKPTGITLEIMVRYMQNEEVFGDKCRELYAFDYTNLKLNDFDKTPGEIAREYIEFEKSPKDINIAKMMTAWSRRNEIPPAEYNPNWIRVKRKRCKERLLKALDRDGYSWN